MKTLSKGLAALVLVAFGPQMAEAAAVTYNFTGIVTIAQGIFATYNGQSILGDTVTGTYAFDYAAANQLTGTVGSTDGWNSTSSYPGNFPGGSLDGQVVFRSTGQVTGTNISYATVGPDTGGNFSTNAGGNAGGSPFAGSEQAYHVAGLTGSFVDLGGGFLAQPSYDSSGLPVFQPSFAPGAQFGGFKINDQTASVGIIQYNLLTLTPVPIPAAGWMTLTALSACGVIARKRKI